MSIEQDITRIADALEALVAISQGGDSKKPATVDAPPGPDHIPGEDAVVIAATSIKTSTDLRDFAQRYLQAAGEKSTDFVAYIKAEICTKFSPSDPKLIKIPEKNIPKAAQMIYDWALKHDIILK